MDLFHELKSLPEEELQSILPEPAKSRSNFGLFEIGNRTLPYLKSSYDDVNFGALAIEIPIALHIYNKVRSWSSPAEGRILEMGCVLPKYLPSWKREAREWERGDKKSRVFPHLCIDPKMEDNVTGVINISVNDVHLPPNKFDLILSLSHLNLVLDKQSTFLTRNTRLYMMTEHIKTLRKALSSVGMLLVSIPWEYKFPLPIEDGEGHALIQHYVEAFHTDDGSNDEAPNLVWKMNRDGYGMAGNTWKQVDLLKSANLPPDEVTGPPSARTIYFMIWGVTHLW
jgi:hypothetical protein